MRIPRYSAEIAFVLLSILLVAAAIILLRVAAERDARILYLESQLEILNKQDPEPPPALDLNRGIIEVPKPIEPRFLFPIYAGDFDRFTSAFGIRDDPLSPGIGGERINDHGGIDAVPLAAVWDARVAPAAPGVVTIHWPPKGRPVPGFPGVTFKGDPDRGAWIEILHDNGWRTRYLHLSWTNPNVVHEGRRVGIEDVIGRVGGSGRTTGSHLHFELINPKGERLNPLPYIDFRVDQSTE